MTKHCKTEDYAGIDYGQFAGTNRNHTTGIHYGVIAQNSVMPEALDDIITHGRDAAYEHQVAELQRIHAGNPEELELALEALNCCWETDFNNYVYDREGYHLTGCLNSDLFVLASPFYTFAQFCSPCVPGAGNLDHPCAAGPKTYCLGHDWFDNGRAPYPVFSVETGAEVMPDDELDAMTMPEEGGAE